MKFKISNDVIEFNLIDNIFIVNNRKISFVEMDKIVKKTRYVNKIYKPYSLLIYIDFKNKKINKWNQYLIKDA